MVSKRTLPRFRHEMAHSETVDFVMSAILRELSNERRTAR